MRIYTVYVINGQSSFSKDIECENCLPTELGFYHFYNTGAKNSGRDKDTIATYPIASTIIKEIKSKSNHKPAESVPNGKINHNEKSL